MSIEVGEYYWHRISNEVGSTPIGMRPRFYQFRGRVLRIYDKLVEVEFDNGIRKKVFKTSLNKEKHKE